MPLKLKFNRPPIDSAASPRPQPDPANPVSSSQRPSNDTTNNDTPRKPSTTIKLARPKPVTKLAAPPTTTTNTPKLKPPAPKPPQPQSTSAPPKRIIKLHSRPPPSIRLKSKGEPPVRPKGSGYDSEASDTELDPALEEQFILRMAPGPDCDYLRAAVEEKRFGSKSQGGADVSFRALARDGRRATVTICGRVYAAALVDLPCVLEAMKSWDKRGWYKSADVCQMLLVLGRVENEEEARNYPLPKDVDPTTRQYAHGLTPPLKWVRKRRFRKRLSNRTIEAVELEVARLMREDMEAVEPPQFEVLDYAQYMKEEEDAAVAAAAKQGAPAGYEAYDDMQEAEAEGEGDGEYTYEGAEGVDDLFGDVPASEATTPTAGAPVETPANVPDTSTTQARSTDTAVKEDSSGDDEFDSDEEEEDAGAGGGGGDGANDLDDDALERQRQLQEAQEEISELEARVAEETKKWEKLTNPILKSKLGRSIHTLKQELELKKVSLGQEE